MILGVEAPSWQGIESQEYLNIPAILHLQPNRVHRRPKWYVVFDWALRYRSYLAF